MATEKPSPAPPESAPRLPRPSVLRRRVRWHTFALTHTRALTRTMQDENRHRPTCHCEAASADLATRRAAAISLPWLGLDVPLLRQRADGKHEFLRDSFTCVYPPSMLADVEGTGVLCLASGGGQQPAVYSLPGAELLSWIWPRGSLRETERQPHAFHPPQPAAAEKFRQGLFSHRDSRLTDAGFHVYLLKAHVRLHEAIPCMASDRIGQRHPLYSGNPRLSARSRFVLFEWGGECPAEREEGMHP